MVSVDRTKGAGVNKKVSSTQKNVLETNYTIRGATQIDLVKAHFFIY